MSKKHDVHIVKHPEGGWATRREGASRAGSRHSTQQEAIEAATETARREHLEVVIHGTDGKIRDKDSYGNDSNPPRDKKH